MSVRIVPDERHRNVAEDLALALMKKEVDIANAGKVVAFNAPGDLTIKTADFHKRYSNDVLTFGAPWDEEEFVLPFTSLRLIPGTPEPIYDVVWCFPKENWPVAEELCGYFNCFMVGPGWIDGVPLVDHMTYWARPYFYSTGKVILYHHAPYEYGGLSVDLVAPIRSSLNAVITNAGPWTQYDTFHPGLLTYTSFNECVDLISYLLRVHSERTIYAQRMNKEAVNHCGIDDIAAKIIRRIFDEKESVRGSADVERLSTECVRDQGHLGLIRQESDSLVRSGQW